MGGAAVLGALGAVIGSGIGRGSQILDVASAVMLPTLGPWGEGMVVAARIRW
jgi:hypothetical protein